MQLSVNETDSKRSDYPGKVYTFGALIIVKKKTTRNVIYLGKRGYILCIVYVFGIGIRPWYAHRLLNIFLKAERTGVRQLKIIAITTPHTTTLQKTNNCFFNKLR